MLFTEKFLLTYQKKRGKEKKENGQKKRNIAKGKVEKFEMGVKSLFETTEICMVYQNENFYWEKAFHAAGKKSRKVNLHPLKNVHAHLHTE